MLDEIICIDVGLPPVIEYYRILSNANKSEHSDKNMSTVDVYLIISFLIKILKKISSKNTIQLSIIVIKLILPCVHSN